MMESVPLLVASTRMGRPVRRPVPSYSIGPRAINTESTGESCGAGIVSSIGGPKADSEGKLCFLSKVRVSSPWSRREEVVPVNEPEYERRLGAYETEMAQLRE